MKILVLNGPNINMLGIREPSVYGTENYENLVHRLKDFAQDHQIELDVQQSNHEGVLVDLIQKAYFEKVNGIVINPGAYTHTSIAILDALKSTQIPTVEVHISDLSKREEFRQVSYVGLYAEKRIIGEGLDGYIHALEYLLEKK